MLIYRGVDFKKPALLWYLCQILGGMISLYLRGQKKTVIYRDSKKKISASLGTNQDFYGTSKRVCFQFILWDDDGMFIQLYSRCLDRHCKDFLLKVG